jgi:hypothetical protein
MGRNPSKYEIHPEKLQMELLNTVVSTKKTTWKYILWISLALSRIGSYIYIYKPVFSIGSVTIFLLRHQVILSRRWGFS